MSCVYFKLIIIWKRCEKTTHTHKTTTINIPNSSIVCLLWLRLSLSTRYYLYIVCMILKIMCAHTHRSMWLKICLRSHLILRACLPTIDYLASLHNKNEKSKFCNRQKKNIILQTTATATAKAPPTTGLWLCQSNKQTNVVVINICLLSACLPVIKYAQDDIVL